MKNYINSLKLNLMPLLFSISLCLWTFNILVENFSIILFIPICIFNIVFFLLFNYYYELSKLGKKYVLIVSIVYILPLLIFSSFLVEFIFNLIIKPQASFADSVSLLFPILSVCYLLSSLVFYFSVNRIRIFVQLLILFIVMTIYMKIESRILNPYFIFSITTFLALFFEKNKRNKLSKGDKSIWKIDYSSSYKGVTIFILLTIIITSIIPRDDQIPTIPFIENIRNALDGTILTTSNPFDPINSTGYLKVNTSMSEQDDKVLFKIKSSEPVYLIRESYRYHGKDDWSSVNFDIDPNNLDDYYQSEVGPIVANNEAETDSLANELDKPKSVKYIKGTTFQQLYIKDKMVHSSIIPQPIILESLLKKHNASIVAEENQMFTKNLVDKKLQMEKKKVSIYPQVDTYGTFLSVPNLYDLNYKALDNTNIKFKYNPFKGELKGEDSTIFGDVLRSTPNTTLNYYENNYNENSLENYLMKNMDINTLLIMIDELKKVSPDIKSYMGDHYYADMNSLREFSDSIGFDYSDGELLNAMLVEAKYIQEAYTQLDESSISDRVRKLAEDLTAEEDSYYRKAKKIEEYFHKNNFTYDLNIRIPRKNNLDYVDYFLFEGKKGYCVQYASAMTILCRSIGIPARVSVGYMADEKEGDYYLVRNKDAHAFCEVYIPGYGWKIFEPTVGRISSIDENLSASGPNWFFSLLGDKLSYILLVMIIILLILPIGFLFSKQIRRLVFLKKVKRSTNNEAVNLIYHNTVEILKRKGIPIKTGETPIKYCNRISNEIDLNIEELGRIFYESNYGGVNPDKEFIQNLLKINEDIYKMKKIKDN